ncbi:hypothetical protein FGO68_gene16473 [Halteria grandinella]|uniref:Uncharacterized protein n=1 Tax=Halteria grandinella TaxID=5974 RepID=A0A8J8P721_HALGN|nr:hypothetical protein FGO68_gene16473 [Halteria grandinella]
MRLITLQWQQCQLPLSTVNILRQFANQSLLNLMGQGNSEWSLNTKWDYLQPKWLISSCKCREYILYSKIH